MQKSNPEEQVIADFVRQAFKPLSGKVDFSPDAADTKMSRGIPVDPESPWPKFRGGALQNGRATVVPKMSDEGPWEYRTGKGIFSSPVIDAAGTVYIGSADHYFYALDARGGLKWRFAAEDIIDSSALLDDRRRVYFGSGDARVYCLDRAGGELIWSFSADSPEEVSRRYGIKTYNLNWFEGNISMLGDGSLIVPNDNYLVYRLNRDTGERESEYPANEMIWSAPAVNPSNDTLYFTSCFFAGVNIFRYDGRKARKKWTAGGLGTISASPMLTSGRPDGALVVGGFDGFVRAYSVRSGRQIWKRGFRDHIYSSPAQLSDGTLVQASCDGTVYGLRPEDGSVAWSFETLQPIRSSPAVDGEDNIYFGSGDGRLYCIDKRGEFRWAYQCIEGDRRDLNGSPGLGPHGVVIGGENGGIFHVPYEYPLSEKGRKDPRAIRTLDDSLPVNGAGFSFLNGFGRVFPQTPEDIGGNDPVSLVHYVRESGKTLLSAIDTRNLDVEVTPEVPVNLQTSANRSFITLSPKETWAGPEGGEIKIRIRGKIKTRLRRIGLKFFGGKTTHSVDQEFRFRVSERPPKKMPYRAPSGYGEIPSIIEICRFSCPNPTMLPSYNQIGFDSLHYLAGVVETGGNSAVLWAVQGRLDEKTGETRVDPNRKDYYVLNLQYDDGLITLYNYGGFTISFFGSWDMPFGTYRISGEPSGSGRLQALIKSGEIKLYGNFLKMTGMSEFRTGHMPVSGAVDLKLWKSASGRIPFFEEDDSPIEARVTVTKSSVLLKLNDSRFIEGEHVYALLLIDGETGMPYCLNYARKTELTFDADGVLREVRLDTSGTALGTKLRVYLMADMYAGFSVEHIGDPE